MESFVTKNWQNCKELWETSCVALIPGAAPLCTFATCLTARRSPTFSHSRSLNMGLTWSRRFAQCTTRAQRFGIFWMRRRWPMLQPPHTARQYCMWGWMSDSTIIFLTRARPGVWATFARPGGGGVDDRPPPQRTRKLRKIATNGKRRSIGRGKFYKIYSHHFFDQVKFDVTGDQKGQIFSKSGYFHRKSQLSQ